ncbi:uncharacterized protein LOC134667241 [Cydia fagiglandana]|uniref:uncharacterized protein LOC134667241 n=1 Tax=Cydia fagiglandana TaxID=1458189 RepID=UPI002FEDFD13
MFPTVDTEENIVQVAPQSNTSSPSKHAQRADSSEGSKRHNNKESVTMLIKEMVFFAALALTTYGALHNSPSKISKHPKATKFFSSDSLVTDWHKGQLTNAHATINNVDLSFVMYYAPWDAESQYVRGQFEEAAMVLSDRVHFSAINCWNPGSECRLQHNKIPSWPILIAYTSTSRGVLYKGPRDAQSMVRFLELVMKPLERISTTEDLVQLLSICDAVAVGYTPITDTSRHYNTWYHAAVKIREFDFIGEVCFGVVTSEDLAVDLGVNSVPSARLMLWNDTKEYVLDESENTWNESSLINWVLENFSQPVGRIVPMWRKAFTFERYVDGSPLLILFTPLNPLYEQLPSYSLLREVAMEYYNCKHNDTLNWTSELVKLQQVQRLMYQQKDFLKYCENHKFKTPSRKTNPLYRKEVVSHNNKYPWNNNTQQQKNQKGGMFNHLFKGGFDISKVVGSDEKSYLMSTLGLVEECSAPVMPAEKSSYDSYEQCQFTEKEKLENEPVLEEEELRTTMLPFEDDPLSPENLIQDNVQHFCKLMRFANTWGPPVHPQRVTTNVSHIHGLACAQNSSLNMLAVDSVRNHHFAEFLGIDITSKKDKTAVVILDSKHESQYLLSEEYSAKSLRDFIHNFTHKRLKRSLRTLVDDADRTHYFGSDGEVEQMGIDEHTVHVVELTTHSFRRLVRKPEMLTIVAVCGGLCSASTTRAALEAARLLAACGVPARAARLDALRHDLAWHYTAVTYPSIFVFSPHSEEGEMRYPPTARVSGSGLLALALRGLRAPQRMRVRLALCARHQSTKEKKTCLRDIREHITTVIGRNLKYWRRTENRELRDALLKRLQYLHRVSLELSLLHTTDLGNDQKEQSLLDSLSNLSKHWDNDVSMLRKNVASSQKLTS